MTSFIDPSLIVLLLGTTAIITYHLIAKKKGVAEWKRILMHLILATVTFSIVMITIRSTLPVLPVLSSFGYPENLSNIQPDQKLLALLQSYNKAIVATSAGIDRLLFYFTWWMLPNAIGALVWLNRQLSQKQ